MPRWEDTIIEDYIDLGPLQASDAVREITGSAIRPVAGRMMRRSSMCCATVSRSAGLAALFGERRFAVFDMGEGSWIREKCLFWPHSCSFSAGSRRCSLRRSCCAAYSWLPIA
jgi:hypothetical protein